MQLRSRKIMEDTHRFSLEEMDEELDVEFQTEDEMPANTNKSNQHETAYNLKKLMSTPHLYTSLSIASIFFLAVLSHLIYKYTSINTAVIFNNVCNNVLAKHKMFPLQNSIIWFDICSGLKNLGENPSRPAVYLLMFEEDALAASSCIAEIITTSANKLTFGHNQWLLLNGTLLSRSRNKDPGILIETLAEFMEFSKIVVITDVQKVPAKLAQGFHFLVDEYNPKIGDAVYIFTMMVPRHQSQPNALVNDILTNSWSELEEDVRQALIVRVSNYVLPIFREDVVTTCPLKTNSTIEINIP